MKLPIIQSFNLRKLKRRGEPGVGFLDKENTNRVAPAMYANDG
ncbi:MAG TPA: hypothetical protein VHC21_03860 [Candidatus Saccharimonadales bacterium]|nr:hypothetical protein [Candidatus Saccharimonadales bacterium]